MTERPIIFNGEMVRAILDGRKTQTRRVIKPQPPEWASSIDSSTPKMGFVKFHGGSYNQQKEYGIPTCPYGKPGDRLWVREAVSRVRRPSGEWMYRADYPVDIASAYKWNPSIHMRRDQSRITLEITDVRVERVQDISADDAKAEGIHILRQRDYGFKRVWDSINAKRGYGWDKNPWVWVVEFRRVDQ